MSGRSAVRTARAPAALVTTLVALLLVLGGCVNVPTSGRVEKVEGEQQACQNCVSVEVAPPSPGDDPLEIVEGYLRANSNYQPNYSVARQFLTTAAAQRWSPEDGVRIYRGSPTATGDEVSLDAPLVGSISRDRSYTAEDRDLPVDFGLVRENGEWRIGSPPSGLLVAAFAFTQFYQSYDLYFVGNRNGNDTGGALVPDPIFLPKLRNPAATASVLVKALLNGPTSWLAPAVTSAIPPNTALSVDSVTIGVDGVATVPLSDTVQSLPDSQRSVLAAQLVYTLRQAVGVRGVLITVNQQNFRVPQSDPSTAVISADAIPSELDPVPPSAGDQLYVVRNRAVQTVDPTSAALTRLAGGLGSGRYPVDSLAVSVADTDLAAVTDAGTVLRRTTVAGAGAGEQTALDGVSGLLRPQFSRYGELWAVGTQGGRQRVWRFGASGRSVVEAPALKDRTIIAFKISPDGTRVALIQRTAKGDRLGLARINRGDSVTVDGWRDLDTTQPGTAQLTRLADVAWIDATNLLVLGSGGAKETTRPYSISEDASSLIDEGESIDWDPVSVSVLLRTQSGVILGRNGQVWRDQGSTWQPLVDGVQAVAYPG